MNNKLRNKWMKRIFPLIALLLLAPWPVAYAYSFDGRVTDQNGVRVEIAESSAQPTWSVVGNAIGGVTPGELFYIDAIDNPADTRGTLYITNAQELNHHYRYLILEIGIYGQTDSGEWELVSTDTFITMRNGRTDFTLPGLAEYKITIDGGSFYATSANGEDGSLSPKFYLEVN